MTSQVIDRDPPVLRRDGDDGGGGGWAWLLTARGIIEAELVRGMLEASGIVPVALDARDPSPSAWLFLSGNVNAPVRVFVPRSLLDDARLALLETGFGAPDPPEAGRQSRMPVEAWAIAIVLVALAIALFAVMTWRSTATCVIGVSC